MLNTYLVGGAVRDKLLGLEPRDLDFVVVGSTPQDMLDLGFTQVGADFPVFLHPETKNEYALARTERKSGHGYKGFAVDFSTAVTLEEDLARRDLTINSMAMDDAGTLFDPFNGQFDLENGILRHTTLAFVEDPLRVLRVARFAARFPQFQVSQATVVLMKLIVGAGETDHLTPERIWAEMAKALGETNPVRFFEVLRSCDALARFLPEVDALFGVPQSPEHHPEVDTGIHTMMALDQATRATESTVVRFAVLVHDLGKGTTGSDLLPAHHGHEQRGVALVDTVCDRLKVPNRFRRLGTVVAENHTRLHGLAAAKAGKVLKLLNRLGAFGNASLVDDFCVACEADARGRLGLENRDYPQVEALNVALRAAQSVTGRSLIDSGVAPGPNFGKVLQQNRIRAIKQVR